MTAPGQLQVDAATGKVTGPAKITYNSPFPTKNGRYGSGAMMGVVEHTMVGDLPGTVAWFNNPASEASAHFGIAEDGEIHQFGPIGKGWIAWAQAAGNDAWYSIEHADAGKPANPLTAAQITASAQLVELLSRFADFPLQETNSVTEKGYGTHVMGGAAWGGHTCPGPGPRAGQRAAIISLAEEIRAESVVHWLSIGQWSLAAAAKEHHTTPEVMLRLAGEAGHGYRPAMKSYIAKGDWNAILPNAVELYAPK